MAEVIPQLGLAIGLLFSFMGLIMARGSIATWTHSFGFLLEWLASELDFSIHYGFGKIHLHLGGPFHRANGFVLSALQAWADGAEIEFGYFLHGNAILWEWTSREIALTAEAAANFGDWLVHVRLPRLAKILATVAFPWPAIYRLIRGEVAKVLPHVGRLVHVVTHTITHETVRVVKYAGAATIPGALTIPHVWPSIRGLTRRAARLERRAHRLEGLLGVTGLAVVMANVLGLPNWRCLTRGNIGRTSRALCGIPTNLLNDFLGILADIWILENVCVLLPFLKTAASDIGTPLVEALTEVGAGICKGSAAPGALRGPVAVLPVALSGAAAGLV